MSIGAALVIITAIVVGCWALVQLVKYGAKALGGGSEETAPSSLRQREVEDMVRRAVREETQPLHEKIERLERTVDEKVEPKRIAPPEDPHDFGLLAEAEAPGEQRRA